MSVVTSGRSQESPLMAETYRNIYGRSVPIHGEGHLFDNEEIVES